MIIADTGFWLALANRRDKHHRRAYDCLEAINEPLVTTWSVMTETCHLLLHRLGDTAQRGFIEGYRDGGFKVFDVDQRHIHRILQLMEKYTTLPMDLADASLVILAEHLGHGRILSTDQRDFETYRWKQHRPFENLLLL
jgi:predicted nucleic acid-binding protein